MKLLARAVLCAVAVSFVLALFATEADARNRRRSWREMRRYTLVLSTAFTYEQEWGDMNKASTFTQDYVLTHTGYLVDPRLVNYTVSGNVGDSLSVSGSGSDYSRYGFRANVTLLDSVSKQKGLKLWKYVPSPISLKYSYQKIADRTYENYGMSFYYTRPGTVRVFSDKKLFYYDDGRQKDFKNQANRRYREKYSDSNYNINTNGSWNRNRNINGNANWNLNRNRNLNRNLNRNANWSNNANFNRNWEADRDLNRNLNYNLDQRRIRRGLFSFSYPYISFDINRSVAKGAGGGYDFLVANLRVNIDNKPRTKKGRPVYHSAYDFYYTYSDRSTSGKKNRVLARSLNRWTKLYMTNSMVYEKTENFSYTDILSDIYYRDEFLYKKQPVGYVVGSNTRYQSDDNGSDFSVSAFGATSVDRTKRLMPGLVSSSQIETSYRRKQGGRDGSANLYNVSLSELLTFTGIKKFKFDARLKTGFNETGVPLRASLRADYRHSRKLGMFALYSLNSGFMMEHRGRTTTHAFTTGVTYSIKPNMIFYGEAIQEFSEQKNGITSSTSSTSLSGRLMWTINARSSLQLNARTYYLDTSSGSLTTFTALYRTRVHRRGNLVVYGSWSKRGDAPEATRFLRVSYNTVIRRLTFDASYWLDMNSVGLTQHRLFFKVTRTFGRAFSRLWGR